MENGKQPLWLPKGTVRAILAMGTVLVVPVLAVMAVLYSDDKTKVAIDVLQLLIGYSAVVLVFYFKERKDNA